MPMHNKPREHYEATAALLGGHYDNKIHTIFLQRNDRFVDGNSPPSLIGEKDRINPDTLEVVPERQKYHHYDQYKPPFVWDYPPSEETGNANTQEAPRAL